MYELYAKIMFLMGNNNSQTKAKGKISRGVGDKELEIRLSTTVFWAIYSNRHAILARNKECVIAVKFVEFLAFFNTSPRVT